jgi:hypothetical protein
VQSSTPISFTAEGQIQTEIAVVVNKQFNLRVVDRDSFSINKKFLAVSRHITLEATVGAVVPEHVHLAIESIKTLIIPSIITWKAYI